jgi:hypothetical protein
MHHKLISFFIHESLLHVDAWKSSWKTTRRNPSIKAPIRPILVWDGDPHRYVGSIATNGFAPRNETFLEALLSYYVEKERTNLALFKIYTILTRI